MNIPVNYIDSSGGGHNFNFSINRIAFAKHLAIAGQGFAPKPSKLFRILGMVLHYSNYIERNSFYNNHFSQPPTGLSDPTEKGQFSNLVGKAIADYLSKRINNSLLTVNYEAEMRLRGLRVIGERPDLLAYTSSSTRFAIEAKGYSKNNAGDMSKHKNQAQSGNQIIPVNFSIASVSYNIYNSISCNYHDPFNENIEIGTAEFINSSKLYYSGFAEFLDEEYFEINEINFLGEDFYEITLSQNNGFISKFIDINRVSLLIPKKIQEYSDSGLTDVIRPFEYIQEKGIYIDNDRIGLKIRQ